LGTEGALEAYPGWCSLILVRESLFASPLLLRAHGD
jgi:hypothetical protein